MTVRKANALALAVGLALVVAVLPAAAQSPNRPPDKAGFPLFLNGQGSVAFSSPVLADLGLSADGTKSIVFGTTQGELWVIRKDNGGNWGVAPGFPVAVGNFIASSPAVGQLAGDATLEIVVGHGDPGNGSSGGVKAYTASGSLLWSVTSFDTVPGAGPDPVFGTPAIGDLDNDGANEVVWGSFDHRLYVVRGSNGTAKPGWPLSLRDTIWSSPALHDIDGDGQLDIIIGRDAHAEGSPVNTPDGGCLHVFRGDGTAVDGFPYTTPSSPAGMTPLCVDQVIQSAPSVGDIDGDGLPEIVHGTGNFYTPPSHSPSERVYAWNCDGSAVAGWPVTIQGQSGASPALADLDGDPALEVVTSANNTLSSSTFHVYAFQGNGTQIFSAVPTDFFGVTLSAGSPLVADVLGDEDPEILVASNSSVVIFSATGTQLTDDGSHPMGVYAFLADGTLTNPVVGDLEDDGAAIEVVAVVGTTNSGGANTKINVWNPINRSNPPPWGAFRRDAARNGVAPGTAGCDGDCTPEGFGNGFFTIEPCRIVDTRNLGSPPIGGPALGDGQLRQLLLAGECNVPLTARAVSANITVTQPTRRGILRFSAGSCPAPNASHISFDSGDTRANNAILGLAADGSGTVSVNAVLDGTGGAVHLILDVNGYFE